MGADIDPEVIRKVVRYQGGYLFWKFREGASKQWNARFANKRAFNCKASNGYLVGRFCGVNLRAHRVVWAVSHGFWPSLIDHINGDRSDNRIGNLREVSQSENMRNASLSVRNKTGQVGVFFDKARGKWAASIRAEGKSINLGRFDLISDAIYARKSAEALYGFHENHGRK